MATFNELRELARNNGTKQKTTKRREDGSSVSIKGIAKEATATSRAELAEREGAALGFKYEDGTNESAMMTGSSARAAVLGIYNQEEATPTVSADAIASDMLSKLTGETDRKQIKQIKDTLLALVKAHKDGSATLSNTVLANVEKAIA